MDTREDRQHGVLREGPLDVDYIERYWVTKAADCPCRSKTAIRALIAEVRQLRGRPVVEMGRPLDDETLAAFIRKYHEATAGTHPHYRVAVLPPPMKVRVRRWWHRLRRR